MQRVKSKLFKKTAESKLDKALGGKEGSDNPIIDKQPRESDGESVSRDEKKTKMQRLKSKFSRKKKDSETSQTTDGEGTDEDDDEQYDSDDPLDHAGLVDAKLDKDYGKTKFTNTTQPATWHVLVRVIEGRDVSGGALKVRASLEGRQKATRTSTDGRPKWRQNLTFSNKDMPLETLATQLLSIKLTRAGRLREHVQGVFSVPLAAIVHQPAMTVSSKWIALRAPSDDDADETENCGFLKVSLCIYGANDSPPPLNDDKESEEVWSAAQLEQHTLRIRIFRIHQLAEELVEAANENTKKTPVTFFVRVRLGDYVMDTPAHQLERYALKEVVSETINLEQEMYLPMDWPTVIEKIKFELFMKRGRKQRCIGQTSIAMRGMYEPGDAGFMPTFGPCFVNFYGHEQLLRLKWRREKKAIQEGTGSKYLARLLCSVDSVDYMGESSQRSDLSHAALAFSKRFENMHRYTCFVSLFACNLINPLFASSVVSFHVSMGEHGSPSAEYSKTRSCTFGAMPNTDNHRYFYMPWGNHKPLTDIHCLWEDVDARLQRYNALMKVASMLSSFVQLLRRAGASAGESASLAMEALDHMDDMLERLENHHDKHSLSTDLDHEWESARKAAIKAMVSDLVGVRWELCQVFENIPERAQRLLSRLRDGVVRIAEECQSSLPLITIKMLAGEKVVGYAQLTAAECYYHPNDALSGEFCGRLRTIRMKWPSLIDRKHRKEESPAVLHLRGWFGRRDDSDAWTEMSRPAETKTFLEVYTHQRRSKLRREQWKPWDGPLWSDENGSVDMTSAVSRDCYGWEAVGNWMCRSSQDMWISTGRSSVVDRCFEVQYRDGESWKKLHYTDFYGGVVEAKGKPPTGWEYVEESWRPDKHLNNGDKSGFVYSLNECFWGENGTVDKEMRPAHKFRRRCIMKKRKATDYSEQLEDLAALENTLGDRLWEFAGNFEKAWHADDICDAAVRRRRYLVEVERKDDLPREREHENFFLPRLFEVHENCSHWQLRCYILWAKDLLPVVKNSARAFVRINYLQKAAQTHIVANSQNPIWSETLVIEKFSIPGDRSQITADPPSILVEVRGEREDDSEMFLGRFEVSPHVICSPTDPRAQPQWHSLTFNKGKTRGAVLAAFELFYVGLGEKDNDTLPLIPMMKAKHENRHEVPGELCPSFDRFAVQFLCWGVRNLSKHHLLSVRRPLAEFVLGDVEVRTPPLANAAKDPNFPNPVITIDEVQLPSCLEFSPPLVLNLYDNRSFRRQPLVGVCHIQNFQKYIRQPAKKGETSHSRHWEKFDKLIYIEEKELGNIKIRPSIQRDGQPRLDWWSKYYSSSGFHSKAPGYEESGMEHICVFKWELERANGYNNFDDFLDTFNLVKSAKGNFDDPEEKEKTGELKGKLFITRLGKDKPVLPDPPGVEFTGPVRCLLRVYVIEARGIQAVRKNGIADSYILVRCGKQKVNLKKSYRADSVDPQFGELVEMEVTVPLEKDLTVSVMDRRKLLPDEEIGTTHIDLENRLLTKWRGTVGLSRQYSIHGELAWRDQAMPLAILKRYCIKMVLPPPELLERKSDVGLKMLGVEFWFSEVKEAMDKEDERYINQIPLERIDAGKDSEEEVEEEHDGGGDRRREKDDNKNDDLGSEPSQKYTKDQKNVTPPEELLKTRRFHRERLMGRPLQNVALYILNTMNLVPEHVESRQLHSALAGSASCGELRMFVDLFPIGLGPIPAPLDISLREPDQYQLRVAVFNVSNAIAVRRSFGQPMSDLYARVFVNGQMKPDKTDVHYRSLDGCGEFNWRFVIDVDFNPWERKIVSYQKTRRFRKAREELVAPLIVIQLFDKHKFRKDRLLGEMVLDMHSFYEGVDDPSSIGLFTKRPRTGKCKNCCTKKCCLVRFCRFCVHTRCCCKIRHTTKEPLPKAPRYREPKDEKHFLSLFDVSTLRGWWPVVSKDLPDEQKKGGGAKKDDDHDEDASYVTGMVEMEISLLTKDEADADPVGKKRKNPNHDPHLPKPHRSKWNYFWITSRFKPCVRWCWHKCGIQIMWWLIIILLVAGSLYAIIDNWPVILIALMKWILGQ